MCEMTTCGSCRSRHQGFTHRCTPDVDTEQVLTLSHASGWARCPGCAQMIELNMGCFHMTCRCKTEFCYLCKALWKSCRCPQWDEARLLATAAERRVDAQLPARHPQLANPPQQAPAARRPVPAATAARYQPVNPSRPAPAAVPRPAPVVNIRPADPHRQVPVATRRLAPIINIPTAVPPSIMALRREAPEPVPLPATSSQTPGTRRAETNARVSAWFTDVPQPWPASTVSDSV
jgi:hypothetical protein